MTLNTGNSTILKLRIHGARVVREIGIMVEHVKTGNDEELLQKIKDVRNETISKRNVTEHLALPIKS